MKVENGVLIKVNNNDIENGTFTKWEGITSIHKHAFSDLESLTRIEIPNSVTSIGDTAFAYCYNLKEITIPDSVKTIGKYVFYDCEKLKYVKLPKNLKEISECLFNGCISLQSISLPNTIKKIGLSAFYNCTSLQYIIIPSKVEKIGPSAFKNCESLEEIELPQSLKTIGDKAFESCKSLKSIEIPENIKEISSCMLQFCHKLKNVKLPNNLEYIGECAFQDCESLYSISLPNSINEIDYGTFDGCRNLVDVKIPDNITIIGECAFSNCRSLENIKLPSNLKIIENNAFESTRIKTIDIPSSVEIIGEEAFKWCINLEEVILNDKLESIGSNCFESCGSLRKVSILSSFINIGDYAFDAPSLIEFAYKDKIYNLEEYKAKFISEEKEKTNIIKCLINLDENVEIPHSIKFPCSLLSKLDKKQLNSILKYDNYKYFKDIYNKYLINHKVYFSMDISDFYKFAYVLGCFSDDLVNINGKQVKVNQKSSVFLKSLLDNNNLYVYDAHELFDNLKIREYNLDFLKYITLIDKDNQYLNFKYLLEKDKIISVIMNDIESVMNQVITDSQGRIVTNPSFKKRIENYLINNAFEGVNTENEDIAEEFLKFKSIKQHNFEDAQKIREAGKNAPRHIVGEPLKEENITEIIAKLKKEITTISMDSKKLIDELYDKEFTYEWLDKHDPKNFTLGLYCDCCASIVSAYYGKDIMRDSIVRNDVQNLIIRNKNDEIVAKATIYVNEKRGYAVFNDIEMNRSYGNEVNMADETDNEEREKIYKAFKRGTYAFIKKYNEVNKDRPITQVNIGWGYNRLKQTIAKFEEESENILEVPNSFQDAKDDQWIIYKK